MTWGEYINDTVKRINDVNAKNILLFMSKNNEREWTPKELKEKLNLDMSIKEIHDKLDIMFQADLITDGISDIRYRGLSDGTLSLILKNRFEEEISSFKVDLKLDFEKQLEELKKDKVSLRNKLNYLVGKFAEYQLATDIRARQRFRISKYFKNVKDDVELNIVDVKLRHLFKRNDGKAMEVDVFAKSDCGKVLIVEVKKTKQAVGRLVVEGFWEKVSVYANLNEGVSVIPAVLSIGGFSKEAEEFCEENGLLMATDIDYLI